jgi:hypothetical protein
MRTLVAVSALLLSVAASAQTTPPAPATPTPPPAVAPAPPADAEPQGFGELKFGASMADLKALFPKVKCRKGSTEKVVA